MNTLNWLWKAKLVRVVDGDTIDMILDTGFNSSRKERLRLAGVDTPEIARLSKEAGLTSKHFVEGWLESDPAKEYPFIVQTFKADSFGRYLARIWHEEDYYSNKDHLSKVLLDNKLAEPFYFKL